MHLNRRDFLKLSAPAICLPVISVVQTSEIGLIETYRAFSPKTDGKAMLNDTSKCIGCRTCEAACQRQNKTSYSNAIVKKLDTNGKEGNLFCKLQCMHCTEATCVKVCPAGALKQHELGFIDYDKDKCIGCGYCVEFCPFQVPRLSGSTLTGVQKMDKCNFCADRVANNQQPACAEACPVGAITFGDHDQLVVEGRERVEMLKKAHPNAMLYGENGLEGLHVMYVLQEPADVYGLPKDPRVPLVATIQQGIFRPLTWIVWGAVTAGLALNVLVARARQIRKKEES
ncbi:4Fe-4S dicluster domain-containing protein [Chloroflexota bacterium]